MHTIGEQQAKDNETKLIGIVKCIEFCGRRNLALRGHRNETWDLASAERPERNPGNLLALLHFRGEAGDQSVKRASMHSRSSRHLKYTGVHVQNELIRGCGNFIREVLLEEVRKGLSSVFWLMKVQSSAKRAASPSSEVCGLRRYRPSGVH